MECNFVARERLIAKTPPQMNHDGGRKAKPRARAWGEDEIANLRNRLEESRHYLIFNLTIATTVSTYRMLRTSQAHADLQLKTLSKIYTIASGLEDATTLAAKETNRNRHLIGSAISLRDVKHSLPRSELVPMVGIKPLPSWTKLEQLLGLVIAIISKDPRRPSHARRPISSTAWAEP